MTNHSNRHASRSISGLSIDVVEFSFHSAIVASLVRGFSSSSNIGFHIRWRQKFGWTEEIPFQRPDVTAFVSNAFRSKVLGAFAFYFRLARRISPRRLFWISTGPELFILPDLIFFFFLVLVGRQRIVLSIRNVERWSMGQEKPKFQDFLRSRIVAWIPKIVFESQTQLENFRERFPGYKGNLGVLPVYFSDSSKIWAANDANGVVPRGGICRVGLVGGLDPQKRDYLGVVDALKKLSSEDRRRIRLLVLGTQNVKDSNVVMRLLEDLVHVETFGAYIPNRAMVSAMRSCQVLLAPLRNDLRYGSHKGTGSTGDLLLSNRKVLLPRSIPLDVGLQAAVIPYGSPEELGEHLARIIRSSKFHSLDSATIDFYSTEIAVARVIKDLWPGDTE